MAPEFHAAGGQRHQMRGDAVELHEHHAHDGGSFGHEIGDAEELLDAQAVGGLVEERGQIVHARDERDTLCPRAEFEVLLDSGVQVSDTAAGLGDGLTVHLEDQPQYAVRRRVLRTHVDDDAFLGEFGVRSRRCADRLDDLVPVLTRDGVDGALASRPVE